MTLTEQILTVAAVVVATMLTRFLPFILIGNSRETPPYIIFLTALHERTNRLRSIGGLPDNLRCGGFHFAEHGCDFNSADDFEEAA